MIELSGVQTNSWLDRQWSEWVALDAALQRGKGPPRQLGVYRIRDAHDTVSLLYVDESGNIRGRLFQLRNAMRKVAKGGKQGSPHWAGASILYYQRTGAIIEISWLLDAVDDEGERKGIECECIAAHRWLLNTNPACQFIAPERRTSG